MLNVISLGAGVQSSVMALMSSCGELPKVDCAIFADTGFEKKETIEHLDWLEKQLSFPVYRVSNGNLKDDVIRAADLKVRVSNPPFFSDAGDGKAGKLWRGCTRDYKVYPLQRKLRELLGLKRVLSKVPLVKLWIGMSEDEIIRMKDSRLSWIENYYPLINARFDRAACLKWWENRNYQRNLSSSSCIGCPHHDDNYWHEMKESDPQSWGEAVAWDDVIRNGIYKCTSKLYLHRLLKPLKEIKFKQKNSAQKVMFGEECEGMCGN